MKQSLIPEALELHQKWLKGEEGGQCACFYRNDLRKVQFSGYDISNIIFTEANLEGHEFRNRPIDRCNFSYANLKDTQFTNCKITDTHFDSAHMFNAVFKNVAFENVTFFTRLSNAYFENCTFFRCIFESQDLSSGIFDTCTFKLSRFVDANLRNIWLTKCKFEDCFIQGADFTNARIKRCTFENMHIDARIQGYSLVCPEEGSFIGYKKCGSYIVKLRITEDALRSSATTRKCRCSKAKVLSITNLDGSDAGIVEVPSNYDSDFVYKVGKIVEVPDFDKNRWEECAEGIHFFITREEAVNYIF